jgi:hypothetical protein
MTLAAGCITTPCEVPAQLYPNWSIYNLFHFKLWNYFLTPNALKYLFNSMMRFSENTQIAYGLNCRLYIISSLFQPNMFFIGDQPIISVNFQFVWVNPALDNQFVLKLKNKLFK